jgi:hypothetical protein
LAGFALDQATTQPKAVSNISLGGRVHPISLSAPNPTPPTPLRSWRSAQVCCSPPQTADAIDATLEVQQDLFARNAIDPEPKIVDIFLDDGSLIS